MLFDPHLYIYHSDMETEICYLTHIYIYIIMIWRLKYAIDPHLYIYHSDMETEICY